MAVPVIDLKKLNGAERQVAMAEIANACGEWGFFQVVAYFRWPNTIISFPGFGGLCVQLLNHGVPHELLDRVQKMCKGHYESSLQKQFKTSAPVQMLQNAQCNSLTEAVTDADWECGFYLHHTSSSSAASPSLPTDFKETMEEFAKEIRELAERILEIMCENLGLRKGYLKDALSGGNSPFFGTKVSHYPPCPRPDLINGLRAHTDAGGLILLLQDDEVAGLQVLKDGRWVNVQPLRHAIVIDIGDQLEVITNGKYKSNWHRVLAMEDGNRMSVASFYNPSSDAMVYPAPQLTTSGDMQLEEEYPRFRSADYMSVYAHQKYLAKEPRLQAMRILNAMKPCAA